MIKRSPGRPRKHEVDKWVSIRFRLPAELRVKLTSVLEEKNKELAYTLSMNSLLLELIQSALNKQS